MDTYSCLPLVSFNGVLVSSLGFTSPATVTVKVAFASALPSLYVTVMVAVPFFTPVTVIVLPLTATVAIFLSPESAVMVPLPLTEAVTAAVDFG